MYTGANAAQDYARWWMIDADCSGEQQLGLGGYCVRGLVIARRETYCLRLSVGD